MISLRKLSSIFFRRPNRVFKEIYSNSLMVDWLSKHSTNNVFNNRENLYKYINDSIVSDQGIDFLEFGVYEGKSLFEWSELNNCKNSRFFGFDTFEGLPEDWDRIKHTDPAGHFDTKGILPKTSDPRIKFIKGLFQNTLNNFLDSYKPNNRIIIHNDSDLYTSSLFLLTTLDEFLKNGTIIIFDEFFCASHEFQAFYDYINSYKKKYNLVACTKENPPVQVAIEFLQ